MGSGSDNIIMYTYANEKRGITKTKTHRQTLARRRVFFYE